VGGGKEERDHALVLAVIILNLFGYLSLPSHPRLMEDFLNLPVILSLFLLSGAPGGCGCPSRAGERPQGSIYPVSSNK